MTWFFEQATFLTGDRSFGVDMEPNISAFPLNFTDFGGLGST